MIKLSFAWIASLTFAAVTSMASANFDGQKIVGGVEATPGEFPFIVSLQEGSFGHFCGGSLIAKNWVLTAAHCVRGGTIDRVVIGLHDKSDTSHAETFTALRAFTHPLYDDATQDYDYALVQLSGNSKYKPVAVNGSEIAIDDMHPISAITAGWGTTSEGSYALPDKLQKVSVNLVSQQTCNVGYTGKITERMICAGYAEGGKDSCQGDSGGPLLVAGLNGQAVLAGVVSWGYGCARPKLYGVYSKVNVAFDWIKQNISN